MDGEDLSSTLQNPFSLLLARTILVEPLRLSSILGDDAESLSLVQSEGLAPGPDPVQIGDYDVDVEEIDVWESDAKVVAQALSQCAPSWFWWAGRCIAVHQEFLSVRSGSLRVELFAISERMDSMQLGVLSLLERGLWECVYKQTDAAKMLLERAEELAQIHISTTGVLGKRTVYQKDLKPQLVLKVQKKSTVNRSHSVTTKLMEFGREHGLRITHVLCSRIINQIKMVWIHHCLDYLLEKLTQVITSFKDWGTPMFFRILNLIQKMQLPVFRN